MRVDDRETVRGFLEEDMIGNAVVWERTFADPDYTEVIADGLPPKAVLAVNPALGPDDVAGLALHAVDREAARAVLSALRPGPCFYHLSELWHLDLVRGRATAVSPRPAWLYRLDPADFVDLQEHEVRPVTPEWALMIAKLWEPDWPAEGYVRSRIEAGPTFGVYDGDELVAWDMTHFETDRVVMMGFLHVREGHRGKGYAKSTGSALIKEILRRGKTPACHVYTDNEPSIRLTEALGFRKVKQQVWGDAILSQEVQ